MTGAGHLGFEELAAGYALDALEPADERRFLRHAVGCADCQRAMVEFTQVVAALAETAPPAEPGDRLEAHVLAVLIPEPDRGERSARNGQRPVAARPVPDPAFPVGDTTVPDIPVPGTTAPGTTVRPAPEQPPAPQAVRRPRSPGRRARWLVAAAAAVVIGVAGAWAGLAATSGGSPAPLAMCAQPHSCSEVTLVSGRTHQVVGKVVLTGHAVWLLPAGLTANSRGQIYVLWQITGTRTPLAVGSFDVESGRSGPVQIGGLAAPYHGTLAFAVSLEHGRIIPSAPSGEIALGQVT